MTVSAATTTELILTARQYAADRKRLDRRAARLRAAVVAACDEGMPEVEAARLAGVTRMTVRAWRGKQ